MTGRVESIENSLAIVRIYVWPSITYGNKHLACPVLLGAGQQLSDLLLDCSHCFRCVEDQIQDDLLQLNPIAAPVLCKTFAKSYCPQPAYRRVEPIA